MNGTTRTRLAAVTAVSGLALLGTAVLAAPAGAHTPVVDAGCTQAASYLHVGLTNYNGSQPNHVKVTIDGQGQADAGFAQSYAFTRDDLTSDAVHTYRVKVTAWDDPDGSKGFSFTKSGQIEACGDQSTPSPTTPAPTTPPPTTPAPTTPAPTTPAPTTPAPLPPADGSEAHSCSTVTVSASDTGARAVVSIGDQDRTVVLFHGKGTLGFPPHTVPLNIVITITAPGRTTTVLHATIPVCGPGQTPPGRPLPTPSPTVSTPVPTTSPTASPTRSQPAPVPAPSTTHSTPAKAPKIPVLTRPKPSPSATPVPVTTAPTNLAYTGTSGLTQILWSAGILLVFGALILAIPALRKRAAR